MALALLGRPEVRLNDEVVAPSTKGLGILAYLAVEGQRAATRGTLGGMLWSDADEHTALANLRSALYRLRNLLDDRDVTPGFFDITRDTLALNPEADIQVDVTDFLTLIRATRSHAHPSLEDCAQCLGKLHKATGLYRGDFLAGYDAASEPFDTWAAVQREALHIQVLDILAQLAEAALHQGDCERALSYARRQIAEEPWRELAHRQAMHALALNGQRAAAVVQYETCARILTDELGIEPEPATRALLDQIRSGAWPAKAVPASSQPRPSAGAGSAHQSPPVVAEPLTAATPVASADLAPSLDPSASPVSSVAAASSARPLNEPTSAASSVATGETVSEGGPILMGGPISMGEPIPMGEPISMGLRPVTLVVVELPEAARSSTQTEFEVWAEALERSLQVAMAEVTQLGGIVSQRRATGLVGAFGAAMAHEDDAERAVLAALAIARSLGPTETSAVRIGVMTDEAVVFARGAGEIAVHVAALAEADALQAGVPPGSVWVAPSTYRRIEPHFTWAWLGEVKVPGLPATPLYRPLAPTAVPAEHDVGGLRAPLVGRNAEMASLHQAVARLRAGIGGIVTLVGPAGIGKSRLVAEAREAHSVAAGLLPGSKRPSGAENGDAGASTALQWVEGRWASYAEEVAYAGWQDALRRLLDLGDDCTRTACTMLEARIAAVCDDASAAIAPYLARLLALPLDDAAEKQLDDLVAAGLLQQATFQAVGELLRGAAGKAPLLLVLEDLHWADAASLALLEHLLTLTDRVPLLLVLVMRPDRTHGAWRLRERVVRDYAHRHTDLWLNPLSAADDERLVHHLVVAGAPSYAAVTETTLRPLQSYVREHAEGNPFFTAELVRALLGRGGTVATGADSGWQVALPSGDVTLPATVQGVLMARIDRLAPVARQVLQLAAVVGRVFTYRVLVDIVIGEVQDSPTPAQSLDTALLQLLRSQMIRESPAPPSERTFIFEHELTREAAYRSLLQRKRHTLHRRVAEALERLYPEQIGSQLGLLAYHWEQSGDAKRAVDYLERAGEQAAAQYANDAATGYFTRALALVPDEDHWTRYRLLLARVDIYERRGPAAAREHDLIRLSEVAAELGDVRAQAQVAVRRARWISTSGDRRAALVQTEEAMALAREAGDLGSQAAGYIAWGHLVGTLEHEPQGLAYAEEALRLARASSDLTLEVESLHAVGRITRDVGLIERSQEAFQEALHLSRKIGDRELEGHSLMSLQTLLQVEGNFRDARPYGVEALRAAREAGQRHLEAAIHMQTSFGAVWEGDYGMALTEAALAAPLWEQLGATGSAAVNQLINGIALREVGAYKAAEESLETALGLLDARRDDLSTVAWALVELAQLAGRLGQTDKARTRAERARDIATREGSTRHYSWYAMVHVNALIILGYILLDQGRLTEATKVMQDAVAVELEVGPQATVAKAHAAMATALLAVDDRRAASAEADKVLAFVRAHAVDDCIDPLRIYLQTYRVLAGLGDPRADGVLEAGHHEMMRRAALLEDAELRRSYLENVTTNREMSAAYRQLHARQSP